MSDNWQKNNNLLPTQFYLNSSVIIKNLEPPSILDNLSKDIWKKFTENKQTDFEFVNKINLWIKLSKVIKTEFPDYALIMAGSTLNGFGLKNSDIDFSFLSKNPVRDRDVSLKLLTELLMFLKQEYNFIDKSNIIPAAVPVIKFEDSRYKIMVDINCNNITNIKNTYLLFCYSQVDWRVKPLAVVIKLWAKKNNIVDSKYRVLSSYPVILMLINFLQSGVSPPVLPCLQQIKEEKFNDINIETINFFEKLDISFVSKNKQSLSELLCGFFSYYKDFNFQKNVICVREGNVIPLLQYKLHYHHDLKTYSNGYVFIEEPFHLNNIGRTVRQLTDFNKIQSAFELSSKSLRMIKSLNALNI